MNDLQALEFYAVIGALVGHWPDMDEKFAVEIAEVVMNSRLAPVD